MGPQKQLCDEIGMVQNQNRLYEIGRKPVLIATDRFGIGF